MDKVLHVLCLITFILLSYTHAEVQSGEYSLLIKNGQEFDISKLSPAPDSGNAYVAGLTHVGSTQLYKLFYTAVSGNTDPYLQYDNIAINRVNDSIKECLGRSTPGGATLCGLGNGETCDTATKLCYDGLTCDDKDTKTCILPFYELTILLSYPYNNLSDEDQSKFLSALISACSTRNHIYTLPSSSIGTTIKFGYAYISNTTITALCTAKSLQYMYDSNNPNKRIDVLSINVSDMISLPSECGNITFDTCNNTSCTLKCPDNTLCTSSSICASSLCLDGTCTSSALYYNLYYTNYYYIILSSMLYIAYIMGILY